MLKIQLENDLKTVIKSLGFDSTDIVCSIPKNPDFGDYTTNAALQISNQPSAIGNQSSDRIAKEISKKMSELDYLEKVEVAGPGFINFYFKLTSLMENVHLVCDYSSMVDPKPKIATGEEIKKEKILLEYAQPNTHKAFHIGHTRNIALGESIARILESVGHSVYRATYGSDIGLPVAKAIWGIKALDSEYKEVKKGSLKEKADFLGKAYAKGATSYDSDEQVKIEINDLNKRIYQRDPKIMPVWEETRRWSIEYLESIYATLGTHFDSEFWESEVEVTGKKVVEGAVGKVFEEDEGAIIFPGEKYGLHNRVFITSEGNPTYEAKELGLAILEYEKSRYERSVHVVDVQQEGYFKVVIKAIDLLFPNLTGKKTHLSYGYVDLKGKKMSSRTGDVVTFDVLFEEVKKKVENIMKPPVIPTEVEGSLSTVKQIPRQARNDNRLVDIVSIGAIKFTMLKFAPTTKILFDLENSVALDGDSGPYVQYTYARAKSVLRNAAYTYQPEIDSSDLVKEERVLLQKIEHFPSVVAEAANSMNPTILTSFLLETAKHFNTFYQKHPIIQSEKKSEFRLALTCSIAVILKQGLYLLGIESPERM